MNRPFSEISLEILSRYFEVLIEVWPQVLVLFLCPIALGLFSIYVIRKRKLKLSKPILRWFEWVVLVGAAAVSIWLALSEASIVDDAFISCRYARHLAEGHGLVYNVGERVEGYTNFLWTVLIALGSLITQIETPFVALCLSLASMVANLFVVLLVGRKLSKDHRPLIYLPVAVGLMSIQHTMVEFGTTGLETSAASLFVNLGILFLISKDTAKNHALAGSMLILAALTRPDHGIFFAAGGVTVLYFSVRLAISEHQRGVKALFKASFTKVASFSAPFLVYLAYLTWKYAYYGSLLPNTYFAKSADSAYFRQGFFYAMTFYLGSHFWLIALVFIGWLFWPSSVKAARLKLFAGLSFVLYNVYVLKVGGDFMYGRFYLSLIPMLLLGSEDFIYAIKTRGSSLLSFRHCLGSLVVTGLVLSTAFGVRIIGPEYHRWYIANEGEVYRLEQIYPPRINHANFRVGNIFNEALPQRDIRPVLATSGIGMLGYYSRLEVVDIVGLTDSYVAHLPITRRGRPGHERTAPMEYLRERNVLFGRFGRHQGHPRQYRNLARVTLPTSTGYNQWFIVAYQRDLLAKIRDVSPEIRFRDFETYLDSYIHNIGAKSRKVVNDDVQWFDGYYFDHNDDPERRKAIDEYLKSNDDGARRNRETREPPAKTGSAKSRPKRLPRRFARPVLRPRNTD